ncbi:MAG: hypothetical protein RM049_05660 [Nostoc sp. DedQUE04]|uniref:hypothetical protein n=1 Tax=Nostoc sp. DedQUE04 TaxID=3075390 RepID=UPI002AD4659D|nr:hypothetical protein [Nostoc sp. DedQUE04]MDZ8134777.1 hypothetical protein [Nostoc sp. DedQUE04]
MASNVLCVERYSRLSLNFASAFPASKMPVPLSSLGVGDRHYIPDPILLSSGNIIGITRFSRQEECDRRQGRSLVLNLGEVLSPLHLRGRTRTYMVIQLSR